MHAHRDSAAVVADFDTAILEHAYVDARGIACHRLVDGIVDYLPHQMVQTALASGADIHAWAFADGLQPLKNLDVAGTVFLFLFALAGSHWRKLLLGDRSGGTVTAGKS